MKIGSLFSGAGQLDEGVRSVIGGTVAWHVEFDRAASKTLEHNYPGAPNHGDITKVDWYTVEPVDVLTGGFPCQDVSPAGAGAGLVEGSRSGLWAEFHRAIGSLRPSLVVIENVRGLLSARTDTSREVVTTGPKGGRKVGRTNRALGRVLADLADIGYDARWLGVRASDAGAAHQRFRVFIIASDSASDRHERGGHTRAGWHGSTDGRIATADPAGYPGRVGNRDGVLTANWGRYAAAIERWERVFGRAAPAATEPAPSGGRRLSPIFVEWLMGWPTGWVTGVPALSRSRQLKILGNGVVPQQAALALRTLLAEQTIEREAVA